MKDEYIDEIVKSLEKCDDISTLNLILALLQKSQQIR